VSLVVLCNCKSRGTWELVFFFISPAGLMARLRKGDHLGLTLKFELNELDPFLGNYFQQLISVTAMQVTGYTVLVSRRSMLHSTWTTLEREPGELRSWFWSPGVACAVAARDGSSFGRGVRWM
jgi:hypothetical protein